eukprot:1048052-Pyramimonas_sp.AAC.1
MDKILDLFLAFAVKLSTGGIPVDSSAGVSRGLRKFRDGLFLPREAPIQRGGARGGTRADLVSGYIPAPPLSV